MDKIKRVTIKPDVAGAERFTEAMRELAELAKSKEGKK